VVATPLAVVAGEIVPQAEAAGEQEMDQSTPLLVGSLVTTAVSCAVAPGFTAVEETEVLTWTARIMTPAAADLVVSLTEVAVIVTGRLTAGGADGAV
jgi:hypothetical protein